LRRACLDGKKVRCSVSNLRRTLKVEAVLRALCKVDKAEVVRRKMHLARDTEATENVQVRLCVEEDRKLASAS
jgi:translation elongation factor P/translation initiation factor 5A